MKWKFAERTPSIYAIAAQSLQWRPDDFWASTPEELATALLNPADQSKLPCSREQMDSMMEAEENG